MSTAEQAIAEWIEQSIRENVIVLVPADEWSARTKAALALEADGQAAGQDELEFWGYDGYDDWRVHLDCSDLAAADHAE